MKALMVVVTSFVAAPALAGPCEELAAAVCPEGKAPALCARFIDREVKKKTRGDQQLAACKGALGDPPTVAAYREKLARESGKHTYRIMIIAKDRKADGKPWDAFGGAPDIDLCIEDDAGKFCVAPIGKPSCKDNLICVVEVALAEKQPVMLDVVDVDARDNDPIGSCMVTPPAAGKALAQCAGELVSVEIVRAEE